MYAKKTMDELARLDPDTAAQAEKHPVIIIMDDIRSMHNVGSAFRTADAFGIKALFLCGYTPAPPHRDIHKTALGATETVEWKHFPTTIEAVNEARAQGYRIYSVEQAHNSTALNKLKAGNDKTALVFGNEVTGVSDEILDISDGCIEIPQWGAKHSLNVSVSMGVVLWELVRR